MKLPQQQPKTGEVFLMRPPAPESCRGDEGFSYRRYWNGLLRTIQALGGRVETLPPRCDKIRDSMFTRDAGIMIHTQDDWGFFAYPSVAVTQLQRKEIEDVRQLLDKKKFAENQCFAGSFQGGNIVFDLVHHVMFWGVNNYDALRHLQKEGCTDDAFDTRQSYAQQPTFARQFMHEVFDGHPSLSGQDEPFRIIPLFIPDQHGIDFFHLDGAFNVLPSGQAVVCREVLSKTALNAIDKIIRRDDQIVISKIEAECCASNFITVGSTVVTPYASDAMRKQFKAFGYETITPVDIGLPDNAWIFGEMAAVRCATLKVTPDMAFPLIGRTSARTI